MKRKTAITYFKSPIGLLKIVGEEEVIKRISFVEGEVRSTEGKLSMAMFRCIRQLEEYFESKREIFDLPLAPDGTDFQKQVWQALHNVPFGVTSTYAKQAQQLGDIKKIRAVGAANGKNPIAIVIPCHRIIGTNGNLTGYAGGLDKKEWLLKHERCLPGYNQLKLFG